MSDEKFTCCDTQDLYVKSPDSRDDADWYGIECFECGAGYPWKFLIWNDAEEKIAQIKKANADVAQPEEQLACTEQVAGSTPAVGCGKCSWSDGYVSTYCSDCYAKIQRANSCVWREIETKINGLSPSCDATKWLACGNYEDFNFCPWCGKPIEVKEGEE